TFQQDVGDVDRHAAGERGRQGVNRRWSVDAAAVEDERRLLQRGLKSERAGPAQVSRRRTHPCIVRAPVRVPGFPVPGSPFVGSAVLVVLGFPVLQVPGSRFLGSWVLVT